MFISSRRKANVLDTQTVNELLKILDQEAGVYEDILKIAKNKTNIIIEGKVNELDNIVKLEQSLVLQMSRIETVREDLTNKMAAQLKLKSSEVTITEILSHVKGTSANKLKEYQVNMTKTLNDLKNTNETNSKLIKSSLDFINFSINLISAVDSGANNYGNSGNVNDSPKRNFFDMKL